jgi:cytochrome c553
MKTLVLLSTGTLIFFALVAGCSNSTAQTTSTPAAASSDVEAPFLPLDHKARLGTTCRSCHGSDGGATLPEDHAVYDTTAYPLVCFGCHRGIVGE